VTHFVHLVELTFENDKVTTFLGFSIDHTCLELLEGIDNFKEVSVIKEEAEVFRLTLLNDSIDWEKQGVLVKVVLQVGSGVCLQSIKS
jgi:hypothetical protein